MRSSKFTRTLKLAGLVALMLVGTSAILSAEESTKKSNSTKQSGSSGTSSQASAAKSNGTTLASNEAAKKSVVAKPTSVPTSVPVQAPRSGGRGPEPYQGVPRLFTGSISTGYDAGASLYVAGTFNQVSTGFPFGVRVGLERTAVDPGDAVRAHEIFIAANPDGDPRKKGETWDVRIDMLAPIKFMKLERTNVFFGGRYKDFDGYFEFIGGAETFDVSSNHFGLGGGLETSFAMSPRVDLLLSAGVDYYFPSVMDGHDTYYRPNEDNSNAIDNYTYKDADEFINQPDVATRILVGIGYHF